MLGVYLHEAWQLRVAVGFPLEHTVEVGRDRLLEECRFGRVDVLLELEVRLIGVGAWLEEELLAAFHLLERRPA